MDWLGALQSHGPPVLGATLAGALIGLEREMRSHPAGLRTHMLVCLASALLMLAAGDPLAWSPGATVETVRVDPVRMAHGILTGIGFLCGGVIFRHGLTVRGLTTAASLWTTSALGVLFGVGAWELAIGGSLLAVTILAAFRWIDGILPQTVVVDLSVRYRRGAEVPRARFVALLREIDLEPGVISTKLLDEGGEVELGATVRAAKGEGADALADRLAADNQVTGFEIEPRKD